MSESKSTVSMPQENQFDDELSLLDLITFVRRNLRSLLGGALIGGVLGLAIAFALPAQWEAKALVRVGQLGNAGSTIEPALQTLDRVKSKSFKNDILLKLGLPINEKNSDANRFRDSLKVNLEKSQLLTLKLSANSYDTVKLQMNGTIKELKEIHDRMSVPTITRLRLELVSIDLELAKASVESERLRKSFDGASLGSERTFSQVALVSNLLLAREAELRNFRERKQVLEEYLSSERTFSTDIVGRIEVSTDPVFPKKTLFAAAGLFIGLLLSVLLSILKPICTRRST